MMLKNGADGNGPMPDIQSMDTAIQKSDVFVGIEDTLMQILLLDPELGEIGIMRVRVTANKVVRLISVKTCGAAGRLFFVKGPWNDGCIEEFIACNKGRHDDRCFGMYENAADE